MESRLWNCRWFKWRNLWSITSREMGEHLRREMICLISRSTGKLEFGDLKFNRGSGSWQGNNWSLWTNRLSQPSPQEQVPRRGIVGRRGRERMGLVLRLFLDCFLQVPKLSNISWRCFLRLRLHPWPTSSTLPLFYLILIWGYLGCHRVLWATAYLWLPLTRSLMK